MQKVYSKKQGNKNFPPAGRQPKKKVKNKSGSDFIYLIIVSAILILVTFFTYRHSIRNGFTNWDDPTYVLENKHVKELSPETVSYFFSHPSASNYHPLTMISLSIDYYYTRKPDIKTTDTLDMDASRFHTTNIILHILNVVLVFFFIWLLSGRRILTGAIVALLFAIHPMHVESVAWIAERKDVLYTFFFLGGLISYLYYLRRNRILYFIGAGILFLLSLLSKPAAVIFPLILLIIDYYLQRKFTFRTVIEKSVLLLFSIGFGLTTYLIQSKDAIANFSTFSVIQRLLFASYGFVMYIWKLLVPVNLSAFYPYPNLTLSGYLPAIFYILPLVVILLAGLTWYSTRYIRVIIFGILFYFISIMLVLQFISVGSALMSDRYSYVPSIGLFFVIGYYTDWLFRKKVKAFRILKYAAVLLLAIYSGILIKLSYNTVRVWENSATLWTDVIQKNQYVEVAHKNRGNYYAGKNLTDLALVDYDVLMQMHTKDAKIYSNLGNIYGLRGEVDKALDAYSKSLALDSTAYDIYLNRGVTLARAKRFNESIRDFEKAMKLNPGEFDVMQVLAYALLDNNQPDKALGYFNTLIGINQHNEDLYLKRGICNYQLKNYEEALTDYNQCISINSSNSSAYINISVLYNARKDYKNALFYAKKAKALGLEIDQKYIDGLIQKQ